MWSIIVIFSRLLNANLFGEPILCMFRKPFFVVLVLRFRPDSSLSVYAAHRFFLRSIRVPNLRGGNNREIGKIISFKDEMKKSTIRAELVPFVAIQVDKLSSEFARIVLTPSE